MRVLLLIACGLLVPRPALAQVTYEGCTNDAGIAVASVPNVTINDIAMATSVNGQPVIVYNPYVVAQVQPQTRLFFYAHECGHHALGHTIAGTHPMTREQAADCWGIRALVQRRMVDDRDIAVIQGDIAAFSRADWTHLPGPQRAINLRACLNGGSTPDDTSCTRPQHPAGDLVACTHGVLHPMGDLYPCSHACMSPYGPVACHPNGDIGSCTHVVHPRGDLTSCTHLLSCRH